MKENTHACFFRRLKISVDLAFLAFFDTKWSRNKALCATYRNIVVTLGNQVTLMSANFYRMSGKIYSIAEQSQFIAHQNVPSKESRPVELTQSGNDTILAAMASRPFLDPADLR